jgi:hypothetical protein
VSNDLLATESKIKLLTPKKYQLSQEGPLVFISPPDEGFKYWMFWVSGLITSGAKCRRWTRKLSKCVMWDRRASKASKDVCGVLNTLDFASKWMKFLPPKKWYVPKIWVISSWELSQSSKASLRPVDEFANADAVKGICVTLEVKIRE